MFRKTIIPVIILFLALAELINAQSDKKFIRQGNREYEKDKYSEAEISYRRAIDKNKGSADAIFNIGDALYKQNKFDDAGKQFVDNHYLIEDKEKKSASLYNLGNSLLMANKVQESIEAYKGSLKLDPSNMEAKYNLAYAQDLLKQQQQKNQEQQDQNKNDQNKDQNEKQDNKKQDQNQNKDQNKEQQQQPQEQQQKISKEDAQRLLNALANDEKNVQEKVKLAKAMKAKVRTVKNW
jgi:Ca-activated chloride channel family protein